MLAAQPVAEPLFEDVRDQMERILQSPTFSRAERLTRFLRFLVDEAAAGRADALKEYTIASEVFDREPSFDPALDTIVRVEARRLRRKLGEYYSAEGRGDRIRIDVPKGAYRPQISWNDLSDLAEPANPPSVVVLPFENRCGDPELDCFCEGISDEIVAGLAKVAGLRVAPCTSAATLKEQQLSVEEIGKSLGVDAVIEGAVRRSGSTLRIVASVAGVSEGYQLWTDRFDREEEDKFAIQDEIAAAVVAACRGTLTHDESRLADAGAAKR